MVKISVVIPAHNEERYLGKTLGSLREQNFLDYETIIVCNGCTDETEEVAQGFVNQKTKILSMEEANVSGARNLGAREAVGEILLFLDADTWLEQNSLKVIAERFGKEQGVGTTLSKPDSSKMKYRLALGFKNLYNRIGLYQGCSGTLVCRKGDFQVVGGYEEIKVKEQRKLILKLKRFGSYVVLPTKAVTSMRRFKDWGLMKATVFWVKQWAKNYVSDLGKEEYEIIR